MTPAPDPRVSIALIKLAEAERLFASVGAKASAASVRKVADDVHQAVRTQHGWDRLFSALTTDGA